MTEEEKKDKRMVWALIKNVIDPDWDQILRFPKIAEKSFEEIPGLMDVSYLERNPLVLQIITSLRTLKAIEESVSDCMRRIYDAYLPAELDNVPVETRALLHPLILLPADPLSEKKKLGSLLISTIWTRYSPTFSPRRLMILLVRALRIRLTRVSSRSQRRSQ